MKLFRGDRFLLNGMGQKITMFPVENGVSIEKGDLVVVNTRTLQACKPKKQSGYYAVGRAVAVFEGEKCDTVLQVRGQVL